MSTDSNNKKVDQGEELVPWFRNHYVCPECGCKWADEWTAMCDDDCPDCGCRHIAPTESEDIEPAPAPM